MQSLSANVSPATPQRAFLTDSAAEVLQFASDSFEAGYGVALATLVQIRGGSARPLGSHMAIRDDCLYCGFVSGGCIEAAIAAEAMDAILNGTDRNIVIGDGSPFFDLVLPCGGSITIAIHVLRDHKPLRRVLAQLESRKPTGLLYQPASQNLAVSEASRPTGWDSDAFVTSYRPRVRLLLYGHSIEAVVTAELAETVGYEVFCDSRRVAPASELIDADTAVALLMHDVDREMPVLHAALKARPFYLGALGSARTHGRRIKHLKELGHDDADIARIRSPIGIFDKAKDARSLALSVLADVAACRI